MRNTIVKGVVAGVLWVMADAVPIWSQSSAIAPLVNTGVSAAMSLGSMANSLAAQQQAQQRAAELQQMEQQRALSTYQPQRKCPTGYHHATVLFSDGSKHRMCVQDEK